MASAIYFGRAGLPTASGGDGLTLYRESWEQQGDQATVKLQVRDTTAADAKALRDQLLGYDLNPDEAVIPVVDNVDSSRTGFYRVQSVKQDPEVTGKEGTGTKLTYRLTADLLRVPGWQAPLFEVVCSGADRSAAHAITEWSWVGAPSTTYALGERWGSRTASMNSAALTGAEVGTIWFAPSGSKTQLYDDSLSYAIAANYYYLSSARVEQSADGGTTFRSLTGRQYGQNAVTGWRLANGQVRVYAGASDGRIVVSTHDGTQWEDKTYKITYNSSGSAVGAFATATVLRNSVEAVAIRLWVDGPSAFTGYVDLTVRRGSWVVEGYTYAAESNQQLGVFLNSVEAGTSVTGGLDATGDDAAGNKYQLRSPSAITKDTTNGGIYLTSAAAAMPFAVCTDQHESTVGGSLTTSGVYFAAMDHHQRIVTR